MILIAFKILIIYQKTDNIFLVYPCYLIKKLLFHYGIVFGFKVEPFLLRDYCILMLQVIYFLVEEWCCILMMTFS